MTTICPYCNKEVDTTDFFEFGDVDQTECEHCEKMFEVTRQVDVTYISQRLECSDDKHSWGDWIRTDIDQSTIDHWSKDEVMKKYAPPSTYSRYVKHCEHCDVLKFSIKYPLHAELEQSKVQEDDY